MISYTQKNSDATLIAHTLHQKLEADWGLKVWLDVKADDKSEKAMEKAVTEAKFVIAIISGGVQPGDGYFERPFCLSELRWAKQAEKFVQPIIDSSDKGRIGELVNMAPEDLRDIGGVDFVDFNRSDDEYFDLGVKKVLRKALENGVPLEIDKNDVMHVGRRMDENRQVHRAGSFSSEKKSLRTSVDG